MRELRSDWWTRILWADAESKLLARDVRAFMRRPDTLEAEIEESHRSASEVHSYVRVRVLEAGPARFGFRIVRVVEDLRAALDHLAHQLAVAGGSDAGRVEFPIVDGANLFEAHSSVTVLGGPYRAAIEAVQPYHEGHEGLWVLEQLARSFRCELPRPVRVLPEQTRTKINAPGGDPDIDVELGPCGPVRESQRIMSFVRRGAIGGIGVSVDPKVTLDVAIDHPLTADMPATDVVRALGREVASIVRDLESRFL